MKCGLNLFYYIISFVYATVSEREFVWPGITSISTFTVTKEQISRCPVLIKSFKWGEKISGWKGWEKNVWERKDFFTDFSVEILEPYFGGAKIENLITGPEEFISIIKLVDYCGNEEDLENSFTYLHDLCILKKMDIIKVYEELVGLSRDLGRLFLRKFSPEECQEDLELFILVVRLLRFEKMKDLEIWIDHLYKYCIKNGAAGNIVRIFGLLAEAEVVTEAEAEAKTEEGIEHLFVKKFMLQEYIKFRPMGIVDGDFYKNNFLPSIECLEITYYHTIKKNMIRAYSSVKMVQDGTLSTLVLDWLLTSLNNLKKLRYGVNGLQPIPTVVSDYNYLFDIIKNNRDLVSISIQLPNSTDFMTKPIKVISPDTRGISLRGKKAPAAKISSPLLELPTRRGSNVNNIQPPKSAVADIIPKSVLTLVDIFGKISELKSLEELTIQSHHGIITSPLDAIGENNFAKVKILNLAGFNFPLIQKETFDWSRFFSKFSKLEEFGIEANIFSLLDVKALIENLPPGLSRLRFFSNQLQNGFSGGQILDLNGLAKLDLLQVNSSRNPFLSYFGYSLTLTVLTFIVDPLVEKLLLANLPLRNLEKLKVLDLQGNEIEDSFFKDDFSSESLEVLCLSNNKLGDGTNLAKFISRCPGLKELHVENCGLDSKFIISLQEIRTKVEKLDLRLNNFDESTVKEFLAQNKSLVHLAVSSTDFLPKIEYGNILALEHLEIGCNGKSKNPIKDIATFAPNLRTLILHNFNFEANGEMLNDVIREGGFKSLFDLSLRGCPDSRQLNSSCPLFKGLVQLPLLCKLKLPIKCFAVDSIEEVKRILYESVPFKEVLFE